MKIYIAGKITGDPSYKLKFGAAEIELRDKGHIALNPALLPEDLPWDDAMRVSGAMLTIADAVLMLPDWRDSVGATREYDIALMSNKPIYYDVNEIDRR